MPATPGPCCTRCSATWPTRPPPNAWPGKSSRACPPARRLLIYSSQSPQLPYIRDIAMASTEGRNIAFIDVQNPAISDHPDVAPASLGLQVTLLNQLLCGVHIAAGRNPRTSSRTSLWSMTAPVLQAADRLALLLNEALDPGYEAPKYARGGGFFRRPSRLRRDGDSLERVVVLGPIASPAGAGGDRQQRDDRRPHTVRIP